MINTQAYIIEQLMQAWEKQLASPTADQIMAQRRTLPSADFGAMPDAMSAPIEFWMQAAEVWQRNWAAPAIALSGTSGTLSVCTL